MRVVTFVKIREYITKHADSDIALRDWNERTTQAYWDNLTDVKNTFNSVDYVKNNRYVFNIKGGNYRLVAIIIFASKKVYIRFIGTHSEYDKIKDIKNI